MLHHDRDMYDLFLLMGDMDVNNLLHMEVMRPFLLLKSGHVNNLQ